MATLSPTLSRTASLLDAAASFRSEVAQKRKIATARQQQPSSLRVKKAPALVIVPGWLSESSQYDDMASYISSKGFKTLIVPLKWYNWIPSLGGRSVRPILDRIDATIAHALNATEEQMQSDDEGPRYSLLDFFKEFVNPKNGAQPSLRKESQAKPSYASPNKVILIGHSAGGWICRILLGGKVPYDGRVYAASQNVSALITLGTPHVCTDKLTKRNMDFVNENYPGASEAKQGVHYVCLAGKFARGQADYGGLWKDFTWQSYELCCGEGDVWGDGVIPIKCATGLEGAEHVILEGVEHFPSARNSQERAWYGSPQVVDKWFPLLLSSASQGQEENVNSIVT